VKTGAHSDLEIIRGLESKENSEEWEEPFLWISLDKKREEKGRGVGKR